MRYIDHNPVRARIVAVSANYEFGSAQQYQRDSGPPWLERRSIEEEACRLAGATHFSPGVYFQAFGDGTSSTTKEIVDLVERRMGARTTVDPLTDLVGTTPLDIQRWMKRKARLADGHVPGLPVCSPASLSRALEQEEEDFGPWRVEWGEGLVPARPRAFNGLAHELAGLSWRELAERQQGSPMRCRRLRSSSGPEQNR